jgi:hypothetical protein
MPRRVDHDAAFKLLLLTFFREFLELFVPTLAAELDPDSFTFLDKESFVDLLDPDRREADLVVQARFRGQLATLIFHLEHQAQPQHLVDRRMFRYFCRFYDTYDLPVFSILCCSYASPTTPVVDQHQIRIAGFDILTFRYHVVQLNQLNWRDYLTSDNPIAAALMSRMSVAPEDRWRVKVACLRRAAGLPIKGSSKRLIAQFVDLYLPLDDFEEAALQAEIATLQPQEQEDIFEFVTSWELKGRAEGQVVGLRTGLLAVVRVRFGEPTPALIAALETVHDPQVLERLLNHASQVANLDALQTLVEQANSAPPTDTPSPAQ